MKKYADRPFALLGVNGDPNRDAGRKLAQDGEVTWRSWWNGPDGRITDEWGVTGFPSYFIIDAKGIVRFTDDDYANDPKSLDATIEKLVAQAERER